MINTSYIGHLVKHNDSIIFIPNTDFITTAKLKYIQENKNEQALIIDFKK
jgi:hypothetical protein